MHQVWSLMGSQAIDWVVPLSWVLGLFVLTARPLIRVYTHPGFQLWSPRPLIGVRTTHASGAGAQAADQGMHPSGGFGSVRPGSWFTDLRVHQLHLRCVLELLIQCSCSRG